MMESPVLWGIDLGGTKIEGAIVNPTAPDKPLSRVRRDTQASRGYEHIIEGICRLVEELERASGLNRPARIGVGTPGVVDPAVGGMKNSNTVCLNNRSFREDLSSALGCQTVLANDANCFALAEATWGAARGMHVVMGLILGTGVGGGIVIGGRVLNGLHGVAGEWGHNPIPGETRRCYCGRVGCVETVIAGPSLEKFHRELGGAPLRLPEIVAQAAEGAPYAVETLSQLREKFGQSIAAVINILDPDAIVIGGGVGNVSLLYDQETRAAIRRHLFNSELKTRILKPLLGDSAGVFGAAKLTV
jgi:fructokinase